MNLIPWRRKDKETTPFDIPKELEDIRLRFERRQESMLSDSGNPTAHPVTVSSGRMLVRIRKSVSKFVTQIFRSSFEDPEWNFEEVDSAVTKESILRRSVEKYVEQIWKNGFEFTGKNPNTVKYIRKRFRQIAQVSGITTQQLFQQMAHSLVQYANVVVVKKRSVKASGGRMRVTYDGKNLLPVAAYFVASPKTIMVDKDDFGNVRRWKQNPRYTNSATTPEWRSDDVVFFKDAGSTDPYYFFAMPMAIPVIPDIKALRETEELALLQAIKFAIPRMHAKVGTQDKPAQQPEVDETALYLDNVSTDAVIVTSSRIEISNVSKGDQVMDLSPYLDYWYGRILAGLGMSKVGMGEGNTANRSTAQTMTAEMQNTTIKFQHIIKDAIEQFMIRELLLEAGYSEETITEDNMVNLHIPEIDLENKIKKENHAINKWTNNGITHDELRIELGMDILPDGDQKKLFAFMIQQTLAEAQAKANSINNNDSPANQHGKQMAKPKVAKDFANVAEALRLYLQELPLTETNSDGTE